MYHKLLKEVGRVLNDPVIINRSVLEAQIIVEGMKRTGASIYVDLGCWAGLLARDVLERIKVDEAILVDGVPQFVEMAEELMADISVSKEDEKIVRFVNAVLIPDKRGYLESMRIPMNDTSAASILSGEGELATPPKQVLTAGQFFHQFFPQGQGVDQKKFYLKVDLEGIDISFIKALFRVGCRPAVVHFEVKDLQKYESFKLVLTQNGYYPPEIPVGMSGEYLEESSGNMMKFQTPHEFWSAMCGPNFAYVLGINPDKVYGPYFKEGILEWLKPNDLLSSKQIAAR